MLFPSILMNITLFSDDPHFDPKSKPDDPKWSMVDVKVHIRLSSYFLV